MAQYDRKDRLYRQAKDEGYRSRAAYKLLELQEKLKFIRKGMKVLDLGCFAGGWLQVAVQAVGPSGRVIGVDLREVEALNPGEPGGNTRNCRTFVGDVTHPATQELLLKENGGAYDLVICDMSPHLTGIRAADEARTADLLDTAFSLNERFLRRGGIFVAKAFPSQDVELVAKKYRKEFEKLDRTILKSSRNTSNEFYFIGKGFRGSSGKDVTG